jgi:hypothetical protein
MGHARPDTANVRDVLLAEPHRVRFTGRTLLRGPFGAKPGDVEAAMQTAAAIGGSSARASSVGGRRPIFDRAPPTPAEGAGQRLLGILIEGPPFKMSAVGSLPVN